MFSATGNIDQAVYWLAEAHRRAPLRPDVTSAFAETLIRARHFDRAQALLSTATKEHPQNAVILKTWGDFYAARHSDPEAMRAYQESLEQDRNQVGARLGLAQLDQRLNEALQAKREYEQVLEIELDNADAHAALGRMALEADDLPSGTQHIEKALRNDPTNLNANEDWAAIEIWEGAFGEALKSLQKLVALDPNNPRFHYQLGQALAKLGRKSEAQAQFLKSEQLQSTPAARMSPEVR
jgi:tetratricopeptide (TPR) repeat protein